MRRLLLTAIALALCAVASVGVQAQTYPSRPVTIIVPFPPGGSTDAAARIMAEGMRPILRRPVVIENVAGGSGLAGVERLVRAAPDGYTIDIGQWDTHVGSIIYNIAYDLEKDFTPIGLISVNPQLLLARKTLEPSDLKGLVAWMKANPGKGMYANQNAAARVAGLLLQKATGTEFQYVPYQGAAPAMIDLVAGKIDLLVVQAAAALPQMRAGSVKAIANLSPQRSAAIPNIPTTGEGGVPGFYMTGWFGFFAPKATPRTAIGKLNAAMVQVLANPKTRTRFAELGLDVAPRSLQTPEGLAAFHKVEMEAWWPIIRAAGITTQ
ncbi:MAG: tripartite tricarboxylate transporter substrate binding protein BugD [Hyphomicrobiaceae bacterium]|nr:tripartite tricarboxylate transporter substrate binding protein BugD [Hyphomicrobiaceae bacterium]